MDTQNTNFMDHDISIPKHFIIENENKKIIIEICKNKNISAKLLLLASYMVVISKYKDTDEVNIIINNTKEGGKYHDNIFNLEVGEIVLNISQEDRFADTIKSLKTLNGGVEISINKNIESQNIKKGIRYAFSLDNNNSIFDKSEKLEIVNFIVRLGKQMEVTVNYPTLYYSRVYYHLIEHCLNVIKAFYMNDAIRNKKISLITRYEEEKILKNWSTTRLTHPKRNYKFVHKIFEEWAAKVPNENAIVCGDDIFTYSELNNYANNIAKCLLEEGLNTGSKIGVAADRSIFSIATLLGIFKIGGVYIPFDPHYPKERIMHIMNVSQTEIVITQEINLSKISGITPRFIAFDDGSDSRRGNDDNINLNYKPDCPAYILFTSGSTGKPKGVMIEHYKLTAMVLGWDQISPAQYPLIGTTVCPFTFDHSLQEIFYILCFGGCLHILNSDVIADPKLLSKYLIEKKITVTTVQTSFVPEVIKILKENKEKNSIKRFVPGVESINQDVLCNLKKLSENTDIIIGYGPTETTVASTLYKFEKAIENEEVTPIGKPFPGDKVYIIDDNMNICPVGIKGEIIIGGLGVAKGYLGDSAIEKKCFVNNPFCEGEIVYRTGDLGRYLPDGNIIFLGRKDNQVKIGGYRIELGEIESILNENEKINMAVAVVKGKEVKRIAVYLKIHNGNVFYGEEIKQYLRNKLPEYMMPSMIEEINTWPLTKSGKVDRKKLSEVSVESKIIDNQIIDDVEREIRDIFVETLGETDIGLYDNIFNLGCSSLAIVAVIPRLENYFHIPIMVSTIINNPTIYSLANHIKDNMNRPGFARGSIS